MRLHTLEICAFGPFADPVTIDFEQLGHSGLFLLSGPTGSGKSSILDAVCFALYGRVAGERERAGHYRSDHADPDQESSVTLECTIGEQRLKIRRTPSWQRPKKRGEGTTKQQSSVVLQVQRGAGWETLSTRLDEVGDQIGQWLGLRLDQFLQVALLPQGGFHAFLHASADDRKKLLERLFRTETYLRIEQLLVEQRRSAANAVAEASAELRETFARFTEATLSDATLTQTPDVRDDHTLVDDEALLDDEALSDWAGQILTGLADEVEGLSGAYSEARTAYEQAVTALDAARQVARDQAVAGEAQERLAELTRRVDEVEALRAQIGDATRAAVVGPLRDSYDQASHAATQAQAALAEALGAVADEISASEAECTDRHLQDAMASLSMQAKLAQDFVPDQVRLRDLETTLSDCQRSRSQLLRRREELHKVLRAEQARSAELKGAIELHQATAMAGSDAQRELLACETQIKERHTCEALRRELRDLRADLDAAIREEDLAKEAQFRAREARIAGMAAELAQRLAVGAECPVCGSCEHPHRAQTGRDHVDDATETQARRAFDDATHHVMTLRESQSRLEANLANTERLISDEPTEAVQQRLDQARKIVQQAEAAPGRLLRDQECLSVVTATIETTLSELESTGDALVDLERRITAHESSAHEIRRRLDALLTEHQASDAEQLAGDLRGRLSCVQRAQQAFQRHHDALTQCDARRATLTTAAHRAGFVSPDAALASWVEPDALHEMQSALGDFDKARTGCEAILAQPEIAAALRLPPPDLDALESTEAELAREIADLHTSLRQVQGRLERGQTLADALAQRARSAAPLKERSRLLHDLSALVEGKSATNEARVSLSAYVLAQRLRQVVDAANERLGRMCAHRFRLQHTEERAVRERLGGLGLQVVDEWTGRTRAPETLSGGESFIVSLALALGLADVVTYEANGVEIGTLFVDEGFGSLDADSLESVLDVLDELRSGGRVVGVVSHVAGMRERIPARLEVIKQRSGSTVRYNQ